MRTDTRKRPGVVLGAVALMATAGSLLRRRWWRKVPAGPRRGPDDGGGLAGVREPRRPIPPTLVDAGAREPDLESS